MPNRNISILFNGGYVSSRDRSGLQQDELQTASGLYYDRGDPQRIHVQKGRTTFDTGSNSVKALQLVLFDSGSDLLVRYSGTVLEKATPGTTGTFDTGSPVISGLNASATRGSFAHYNDRWYFVNGLDRMRAINSDGTSRRAGMDPPDEAPTVTEDAIVGAENHPTGVLAGATFTNTSNVTDTDADTFMHCTVGQVSDPSSCTATFTYDSAVGAGRVLYIKWRLVGATRYDIEPPRDSFGLGLGGGSLDGYDVEVKFEIDDDTGSFVEIFKRQYIASTGTTQFIAYPIAATNNQDVQVRCTFTQLGALDSPTATMQVYELPIRRNGTGANFSTTTNEGIRYAIAEYDQNTGFQSPVGPPSKKLTFTDKNIVTVTLPATPRNTNTTHYVVYRTPDGGTVPFQLGEVIKVDTSATTFVDNFDFPFDEQLTPVADFVSVDDPNGTGTIPYARDKPPINLSQIIAFKGRLIGLSSQNPRALFGSVLGLPESWPEINVVDKFPFREHDQLVAMADLGEVVVLAAKGMVLVLTDFPEVVLGVFNAAEVRRMGGAPGCVNQDCLVTYTIGESGEPRAAWVSRFGVHTTNGETFENISDDLDWDGSLTGSAEVDTANLDTNGSLHWDPERRLLIFNDRTNEFLFHMDPKLRKQNRMPLITKTAKVTTAITSAILDDGTFKVYSGDTSGTVYLEENGTGAAWSIKTGRAYFDWNAMSVYRANLRHTDFGSSATATLTWTAFDDTTQTTQAKSRTVSLSGYRGTDIFIGNYGEAHEITLTGSAGATGSLLDLRAEVIPRGRAGKIAS